MAETDEAVRLAEIRWRLEAATAHAPIPWRVIADKTGFPHEIRATDVKGLNCAKLFDVRGWGYLTGGGHGALGLPKLEAEQCMKDYASFAANAPADIAWLLSRPSAQEREIKEAALRDLAYANGAQFGMRASESPEMEAQVRRAIDRHTSDAIRALSDTTAG